MGGDKRVTLFFSLLTAMLKIKVVIDEIEVDGADIGPKRENFSASKVTIIEPKCNSNEAIVRFMCPKS